jgi:hypothetical protein
MVGLHTKMYEIGFIANYWDQNQYGPQKTSLQRSHTELHVTRVANVAGLACNTYNPLSKVKIKE